MRSQQDTKPNGRVVIGTDELRNQRGWILDPGPVLLLAAGDFKAVMFNTGQGVRRAVWINFKQWLDLFIKEALHQVHPELVVVVFQWDEAVDLDGKQVVGV